MYMECDCSISVIHFYSIEKQYVNALHEIVHQFADKGNMYIIIINIALQLFLKDHLFDILSSDSEI